MAINRVPYRTSLRVLGRLLNGEKARLVTVCEIDQGFLLHYAAQGDPRRMTSRAIHGAEVLDLDDVLQGQRGKTDSSSAFKGLQSILGSRQNDALKFQKSHPLAPMGYEELLRSVGAAIDGRHGQAILVSELDDCLHVEYTVDRADFVVRNGQRMALPGRRADRYDAKGVAMLVRGCRDRAVEDVRRTADHLAYNPYDAGSYLSAALVLEDDGQYRDAEDLFRKAAQLAPTHAEAHYHVARHARRRGDRKAALKNLQQAVTLHGEDGRFFHLLGRINAERDHLDAAVAAFQQAIACDPGNRIYHFDLSRVYERMGRPEDARAALACGGYVEERQSAVAPASGPWAGGEAAPAPVAVAAPSGPASAIAAPDAPAAVPPATPLPAQPASRQDAPAALVPLPAPAVSTSAPHSLAARLGTFDDALAAPQFAKHAASLPAALPGGMPSWESVPAGGQSAVSGDGDAASSSGLPTLGLSGGDWPSTASALRPLETPSAGELAATALPLAATAQPEIPARDATVPAHGAWSALQPTALPDAPASAFAAPTAHIDVPSPGIAPAEAATDPNEIVQLAAAIMRVEELVRAEPHRADLHRRLGFLLAKQGRSEEAAAEFRLAVECGRRRLIG